MIVRPATIHLLPGDPAPCLSLMKKLDDAAIPLVVQTVGDDGYPHAIVRFENGVSLIDLPPGTTTHVIFHELLHVKRMRFDRKPFLSVVQEASDQVRFDISVLGNNLQHAFIFPEEFRAYPFAEQYRRDMFLEEASKTALPAGENALRRAWILAMLYATSTLIFDLESGISEKLRQACASFGVCTERLTLDPRREYDEAELFEEFSSAYKYFCHDYVRMAQFDERQCPGWIDLKHPNHRRNQVAR